MYILSIYAINLTTIENPNRKLLSGRTLHPYAAVKIRENSDDGMEEHILGRTETLKNARNPVWVETFDLDYDKNGDAALLINLFHEPEDGSGDVLVEENVSFNLADFFREDKLTMTRIRRLSNGGTYVLLSLCFILFIHRYCIAQFFTTWTMELKLLV